MAVTLGIDPHCSEPVTDDDDYIEVRAGDEQPPGQVMNEGNIERHESLTFQPLRMHFSNSTYYHRDCYLDRLAGDPPGQRKAPGERRSGSVNAEQRRQGGNPPDRGSAPTRQPGPS